MTGDDVNGYSFTTAWLKYALPPLAALALWVVILVVGFTPDLDPFPNPAFRVALLVLGALTVLAYGWVVVRKLVRRASFDGRRLRAATLLGQDEIDLADVTGVSWNSAGTGTLGALVPFAGATARIRHRGGHLLVPMPAGSELIQRLEAAGAPSAGAASEERGHRGEAHELDLSTGARHVQLFIAAMPLPWLVGATVVTVQGNPQPQWWFLVVAGVVAAALMVRFARTRVVTRAVLDDRHLRATTADGHDHRVELTGLQISGASLLGRLNNSVARLNHPGGTLWVKLPGGAELVDRLRAAGVDR